MPDEYQQIAALLCYDIDTMLITVERHQDMAVDMFRELKRRKDEMVNDSDKRESRYISTGNILQLMKRNNEKENGKL